MRPFLVKPFLCALPLALVFPAAARAALSASASLTSTFNGTNWHYDATLQDTGDTDVGTFWYAWVPGKDFLQTSPTNIQSPFGWTSTVTHFPDSPTNGYAIQWKVDGDDVYDLLPGESFAGFSFDTPDSPTQLAGDSTFYSGTPTGTSFVYSGAPFSDAGFQFVAAPATPAPEPASLGLLSLGMLMLVRRKR